MRLASLLALAALCAVGCADSGSSGGDGGSVADGGGGGDGGLPAATLTEQQLIDACLRATACSVRPYPALSNCIDAYRSLYVGQGIAPIYDAIYTCVNKTGGDCARIKDCFDQRATCTSSYQATCQGTVAISCDLIDKRIYTVDCKLAGLECAVKTDQSFTAVCTRGTCAAGYKSSCEGDIALSCSAGVVETRDCAQQGRRCRVNKDGEATCAGNTTQPCDPRVAAKCDGNTSISCVGAFVHREECSTSCQGGACSAAQTACNVGDQNRCAGDKLEACVGGAWKSYDCVALGLGVCVTQAAGWASCGTP